MPKRDTFIGFIYMVLAFSFILAPITAQTKNYELKRVLLPKPNYQIIPKKLNSSQIIMKFNEGINQPHIVPRE